MSGPEDSTLPSRHEPALWAWGDAASALEEHWRAHGVVAIPTESTFGLAVDPASAEAVDAVVRIKGRRPDHPLPVVAGAVEDLERLGVRLDLPELAPVIAAWPAALTVVAPLERPLAAALGADTLAVRIPDHGPLRELLASLGRAVTATSANRSGETPVTGVAGALELLAGENAIVIDEASLAGGEPSTIVALRGGRLTVLRQGRFAIEELLGA